MQRKKVSGTILFLSLLLLSSLPLWGQEMDYNSDQYAEYQRVVSIEDPAERAEAILTFMKEHEGLSLVQYALKSYGDLLEQFRTGGQFDNYLTYAEKLIEVRSDDKELTNNLIQSMTFSAFQLQNYEATMKYGERAYAIAPSGNLAFVLANSYSKTGDKANFAKYGEIALKELDPGQTIDIATGLRSKAIEEENFSKASEHARAVIRSLDAIQKPASVSDADWKAYTQGERWVSELIIGRSLYEAEKFREAVKQFEKLTARGVDTKFRGEAFYYMGLSHWKQNELDPAMRAFALGSVLKAPGHSEACQKYLEQLYKSTHNQSTAGLDEYLARVTKSE